MYKANINTEMILHVLEYTMKGLYFRHENLQPLYTVVCDYINTMKTTFDFNFDLY